MRSDEDRAADKHARDEAAAQRLAAIEANSPWLNLSEGAAHEKRSKRWLAAEAKAGRVRCCRVGGRGELMFRLEWLNQHLEDLSTPVMLPGRRRA